MFQVSNPFYFILLFHFFFNIHLQNFASIVIVINIQTIINTNFINKGIAYATSNIINVSGLNASINFIIIVSNFYPNILLEH